MNSKFEQWKVIADSLYAFFGKFSEVVIHDLKTPDKSLIYIKGNLTNREIGDPTTNIVIDELEKEECSDFIITDMETKDGKTLKSLSIFIKENQQTIGCICLLIDPTAFVLVSNLINEFAQRTSIDKKEKEIDTKHVLNVTDEIIDSSINEQSTPVALMQKEDKIKIVSQLQDQGVFLMKGSVDLVANKLNVSRYTIYNYLDEIKSHGNQMGV